MRCRSTSSRTSNSPNSPRASKNAPKKARNPSRWSRRSANRKPVEDASQGHREAGDQGSQGEASRRRHRRCPSRDRPKPSRRREEPPKVDPIAEALKKDEAKKQARRHAQKAKARAKAEQQRKQPKFDPNQIAALLDKRDSAAHGRDRRRVGAVPASLGVPQRQRGEAVAERARRAARAAHAVVESAGRRAEAGGTDRDVRIQLSRDGRLAASAAGADHRGGADVRQRRATAPSARCSCGQPFNMLSAGDTTNCGRTSKSPSIRATCSGADEACFRTASHFMSDDLVDPSTPALLTRRRTC